MKKDTLGDRMKDNYESRSKTFLTRRTPVIIRLDGKAFHTFTKGMKKPFDNILMETMQETTKYLCENIQGCKMGYTQSDEITLLLTDYDTLTTDAWFNYNVQKMCSVSASIATLAFNRIFEAKFRETCALRKDMFDDSVDTEIQKYLDVLSDKLYLAMFDSRCFNIPKEEVANCFIWRQQDATRNSVSMVAQANFFHSELQKKGSIIMQNMLLVKKNINWNDFSPSEKRGTSIVKTKKIIDGVERKSKWKIDKETPIFSQNREYIENLI